MTQPTEQRKPQQATVLQMLDRAQKEGGWTDEEFERSLGAEGMSLMALIRAGIVQFAYKTVLDLEPHVKENVLEVLRAVIHSRAEDAAESIGQIYKELAISSDSTQIVRAYEAALNGGDKPTVLKLPRATVLVVPDVMMQSVGMQDT